MVNKSENWKTEKIFTFPIFIIYQPCSPWIKNIHVNIPYIIVITIILNFWSFPLLLINNNIEYSQLLRIDVTCPPRRLSDDFRLSSSISLNISMFNHINDDENDKLMIQHNIFIYWRVSEIEYYKRILLNDLFSDWLPLDKLFSRDHLRNDDLES